MEALQRNHSKAPAKPLLRALAGERLNRPPVWLMRQAGRYLPEYRAVRQRVGSFLDLCFTPKLAAEVTLQPVRRFGMDAAILFSDILVVPYALGQAVRFEEGEGPVLDPVRDGDAVERLSTANFHERLGPVYDAVVEVAAALPSDTALIGFAGAPWTVACYMLEGGSSRDFSAVKLWALRHEQEFARLLDLLVEATADYLIRQVEAGAEALQIFDSWAGALAEAEFERWCIAPLAAITCRVRARHPEIPIIAFPRGGGFGCELLVARAGIQGIALDPTVPLRWAAERLQQHSALQGNLDPALLAAGGAVMERQVHRILKAWSKGAFIFNLGHGVLPSTPPEHVASLVGLIKSWRE
ncbi:MAG TPA: uroporphyrinogen decarboxylase [Alphaproteobacteria bacterium]|nr:uroporphyrinogen decarboxylase [Alphaproteobacteria bacterium]